MNTTFLTSVDVLHIHADQIRRYGGEAGIRDYNLLLSAIAQPPAKFRKEYLHRSIYDKAAAYLFHLCQNHPFLDGNKRTALVSTLVFLDINGKPITYKEKPLEDLVFATARGEASKEESAHFLK